ncbi:pseudouridine synthase [Synergistales bacterium]|nr:pseudouridine synthase [Synergistales bacterium]
MSDTGSQNLQDPREISYPIRLNRYISSCGAASRRKADELIASGRVAVDGTIDVSLGQTLNKPSEVRVDGEVIGAQRLVYIVMNKPRGVLSAVSDRRDRTVMNLMPNFYRKLGIFPVGRLDKESEGLIILTNDGKFSQEIIHPSSCIKRVYMVFLSAAIGAEALDNWRDGVMIDGRLAKPIEVSRGDETGKIFKVVLGEGFKREIRLMVRALGSRVLKLRRIGIGNLFIKNLPLGAFNEYNYKDLSDMIKFGGEV